MLKCVMSAELACVEYVDDVIKELEKQIELVQGSAKANHKVAKVRRFSLCEILAPWCI